MHDPVVIVGGGLAGLTAARTLRARGIDFVLVEARDRLGGRILSVDASGRPSSDGFDLGPSWFWPDMHEELGAFVGELGLSVFAQAEDGDVVFERMPGEAPRRFRGMSQQPRSMRLRGGTASIVSALAADLPAEAVRLRTRLRAVSRTGERLTLDLEDDHDGRITLTASHVIFALPPRLLEATVSFGPPVDPQTARLWRDTPTWMAPHAKFVAVYDRPFWREQGLSGTAQSMVGPLGEIHDATSASGAAALFGFLGIPAERRLAAGEEAIIAASLEQLGRLFGPEATRPRATLFKDWTADPLTATDADRLAGGHPVPATRAWIDGAWRDRVILAGSETSGMAPGYLAGAVEAGQRGASELVAQTIQPSRRHEHAQG